MKIRAYFLVLDFLLIIFVNMRIHRRLLLGKNVDNLLNFIKNESLFNREILIFL